MRKAAYHILIYILSLFVLASCDVHEFPEERNERVPFTLHLNFDTELPFHKEVVYTRSGEEETKAPIKAHDVRYIINAYRTDNVYGQNTTPDATFVFSHSDLNNLNYTAQLDLPEGTYDFRVWCDHVDAGSQSDKYYDTSSFEEIILKSRKNHVGSNDFRDAFRGSTTGKVINPAYYRGPVLDTIENEATVEMSRPMGKVEFISTDVEIFLTRVAQMLQKKGLLSHIDLDSANAYELLLQSIDLGQFKVIITYNIYMPCSFNIFNDAPASSWEVVSFQSQMQRISQTDMLLGFDYVFTRDTGTTLSMSVDVYDKDDVLMSRSRAVDVPIVRGKYTTVRGEFLTSMATGGVSINPGYDGEDYNIDITIR